MSTPLIGKSAGLLEAHLAQSGCKGALPFVLVGLAGLVHLTCLLCRHHVCKVFLQGLTSCLCGSEGMDLSGVRQQILSSNKTASAKAELFLLERKVDELSLNEWRELIAVIPEDVEKEIGRLMSEGTHDLALKLDVLVKAILTHG